MVEAAAPTPVAGLPLLSAFVPRFVAAGAQHTVVASEDGCVLVTGSNRHGQLGHHLPPALRAFDFLEGFRMAQPVVDVRCGWSHSLLWLANGELWAWGRSDYGQLGQGAQIPATAAAEPVRVPCPGPVVAFAVGSEHALALVALDGGRENRVLGWGWNEHGNVGAPPELAHVREPTPVPVPASVVDVQRVACGGGHSLLVGTAVAP